MNMLTIMLSLLLSLGLVSQDEINEGSYDEEAIEELFITESQNLTRDEDVDF